MIPCERTTPRSTTLEPTGQNRTAGTRGQWDPRPIGPEVSRNPRPVESKVSGDLRSAGS